ncbi:MAG TPA: hypothetical protein VMR29_03940 [Candidatus Binatia bacterium]|nr:hypothetical protein [Candidatus Binatia bacterium]
MSGAARSIPPPIPEPPPAHARLALGAYGDLFEVALLGSLLLPLVTVVCSHYDLAARFDAGYIAGVSLALAAVGLASAIVHRALRARHPALGRLAAEQAAALDRLDSRWLLRAIAASAALSLLLELAVIRWQSSVFEFYAFYKNLGLLSCFLGLGIGYGLAREREVPLFAVAPLLGWQLLLLTAMRYGLSRQRLESLLVNPFRETLTMGVHNATTIAHFVAVYYFVIVVFVLTALAFVPIGQLCGRLMERGETLSAYGMNLLGSLLGVLAMLFMSHEWAPPATWFGACFVALLFFQSFERWSLTACACASLVTMMVLTWPVSVGWERIFSPYQLVERGADAAGASTIRAAGHFYQTMFDLSPPRRSAALDRIALYYELPYRIHSPAGEVAVVGAGTGNDVAAALRSGATRVDAVEIDPAILRIGETYHPEKPYDDRRVRRIVDDARSFLRNSTRSYDLLVYGLLDSHSILSQASSVRVDSFVYTVEGLREARARLKPGGTVSLSFLVMTPELGRKIFLMLQEAFDGRPPLAIAAVHPNVTVFLQGHDATPTLPAGALEEGKFQDVTASYAQPTILADVSTDDWPFFYMPRRIFPASYVALLGMLVAVSYVVVRRLLGGIDNRREPAFFFLGAGFMLVETKAVTELGLTFGNTWLVIGAVICGVLGMALIANALAQVSSLEGRQWPYVLLLASLAVGFAVSRHGGLPSTAWGRLGEVLLLTCPILFSGLIFSSLLRGCADVSGAMGSNVLGAMCGGVLEYHSMYFGFSALYLVAMIVYGIAFVASQRSIAT